jgi:hypothetical protein
MPLRLKEVHIVRQPFLFNMVWPMFKQFVGDKLKNRVSNPAVVAIRVRFHSGSGSTPPPPRDRETEIKSNPAKEYSSKKF